MYKWWMLLDTGHEGYTEYTGPAPEGKYMGVTNDKGLTDYGTVIAAYSTGVKV